MAFTIPNIENIPSTAASISPYFDAQAVPDSTDWMATASSESGTGIVSGMNVVPLATPGMGASVNSGSYLISGLKYGYGGGSVAVTAASVTDRRDLVSIASGSVVTVTAGTPCGTAGWTRSSSNLPPVKPSIPANNVVLGEIYVSSTTTSIQGGNIVDKTTLVLAGNYAGGVLSGTVSISATTATKIFDTASLGIGTWLLDLQCLVLGGTGTNADGWVGYVAMDSASGSFVGPTSCQQVKGLASAWVELNMCVIAVVTSAGTISFNVYGAVAGTAEGSDYHSQGNATGYTAVRIA